MSADPRLVAVRERVQVDCPIQEAFDLFTTRMGEWWPLDLAPTGVSGPTRSSSSRGSGGASSSGSATATSSQVGSVVACEPPRRIAFTWRTADWEGETEVEVTFTPEQAGTRVELEHRGFERLGSVGPDAAARFRGGWPGMLAAYTGRAAAS